MKKDQDKVFQYEEIFSLMLNMYHQFVYDKKDPQTEIRSVEKYFYRLTRLALGEFEFARRLAYEGISVNRLTHYDQLSKIYKQHAPEDFIINNGNLTAFIDVKYYDNNRLLKFIPLNTQDIKRACFNKSMFKVDKSFFAIKRFNKWYLLDAEKANIFFKDKTKDVQFLPIERLLEFCDHDVIKEKSVCLNIGGRGYFKGAKLNLHSPSDTRLKIGIDLYSIGKAPEDRKEIEFQVWNEKEEKKTVLATDNQARILWTTFHTIEYELKNLLIRNEIKQIDEIENFTDILPTEFTITDSLFTTEAITVKYGEKPKDISEKYLNSLYSSNWIIEDHLEYLLGKSWVLIKSKISKENK